MFPPTLLSCYRRFLRALQQNRAQPRLLYLLIETCNARSQRFNTQFCQVPYYFLHRSFNILKTDDSTKAIFSQPQLKAYRRANNLRDLLVDSDVPPDHPPHQPGNLSLQMNHLSYLSTHQSVNLNSNTRRTHYDHRAFHVHYRN